MLVQLLTRLKATSLFGQPPRPAARQSRAQASSTQPSAAATLLADVQATARGQTRAKQPPEQEINSYAPPVVPDYLQPANSTLDARSTGYCPPASPSYLDRVEPDTSKSKQIVVEAPQSDQQSWLDQLPTPPSSRPGPKGADTSEAPHEFVCPISLELMMVSEHFNPILFDLP